MGHTDMKETMNQATVVMAKCRRSKQPYGIRMEKKRDGVWYCTWAFKLSERAAANEGYGGTLVSGRVDLDAEYPGCPYCGAMGWFSCGSCGKLTCNSGEIHVTCSWCNMSGECSAAESFDLKGDGY